MRSKNLYDIVPSTMAAKRTKPAVQELKKDLLLLLDLLECVDYSRMDEWWVKCVKHLNIKYPRVGSPPEDPPYKETPVEMEAQ